MTSGNTIRREAVGSIQRGTGEALDSYIGRLRSKLDFLGSVCEVHFAWYTHRNIAGCWICDTITALAVVLQELESLGPYIVEGQARLEEAVAEGIYGKVPPKDS